MDNWEKFNETSLPEKEDFYSHLNIEDITHTNYPDAKKNLQIFWNRKYRRVLWFARSEYYIIVSWGIWEV